MKRSLLFFAVVVVVVYFFHTRPNNKRKVEKEIQASTVDYLLENRISELNVETDSVVKESKPSQLREELQKFFAKQHLDEEGMRRLKENYENYLAIREDKFKEYIDNKLNTGATPYSYFYGENKSCSNNRCSQIKITASEKLDVLVTIKKDNEVVRHAYIRAGDSFTFEMSNGIYQPFFYSGKGWNPEKIMKDTPKGKIIGGFVKSASFGKDEPQDLNNSILEYQLISQINGNFSSIPSDAEDAL